MVERNVILDCDTGEDDALAILVALQHKLLLHYVVTSHGNTTIEHSTDNTSKILSYTDYLKIKVVKGSRRSLETHLHKQEGESAGDFVGKNGLCNLELPPSKVKNVMEPDEKEFPEFLSDLIKNESPVDYIITGPSTNFARACLYLKGSINDYVKNVYVMGGALHSPGNSGPIDPTTAKGYAEFNFYCDPNAINIVLGSGLPIHLVTWDITSTLTVPYDRVQSFQSTNPVGEFTINLMQNFFEYYGREHVRNFELNDPITVMARLGYGRYKEERIRVITDSIEYGRCVLDPNGHSIQYFFLEKEQKNEIIEAVLRTLDIK